MPNTEAAPAAARPFAKTEQVITTLLPRRLDQLDAYAEKNEVSRAEAIRTFIHEGLDRIEEDDPS